VYTLSDSDIHRFLTNRWQKTDEFPVSHCAKVEKSDLVASTVITWNSFHGWQLADYRILKAFGVTHVSCSRHQMKVAVGVQ